MDESQDLMSNEHPRYLLRLLATIIVLLYLGAMIIIFFLSDLKTVYEPPLLLLIGNTIFAGLIPIAVSIIAARAFLFSGLNSLLFMGCGMMTFGCGAAMAGWLIDGRQVPNVNVTIMNVGALLGSAFHVVGAILALRKKPETVPERRKYNLTVAYSGMFFVVFFMTLAARGGITPLFFIQDVGPTLLRQVVLGSAVILFLLSALIIMRIFVKSKQDFHYWYALSLIMIALGLFAFFIQKSVGSPIGWMGRSGEYIGGIFALIAILFIVRSARIKGESIQSTLVGLFQDAEFNYQVLVEIITDAIVYFEQDGKIIQWNSAAEKVFGYRQSEAVGASLFDLVIDEASITIFRKEINNLSIIDDRRKVGRLLEISGKTKDRGLIPVEVSTSAMKVRDKWSFLCMFRDITERKNAEAAIQKLNDNLEQRVEERTRQLSASEQRLSLATRAGKIGIWDWEVENEKLIWDDSMYSLYGIRKEDFGGSFESWIQTLHPDDRQFVKGEIQAALRGEWEYATEFRIVQPDGAVRIINAASQTLRDRDGKALRMIGTNIDITERKQTEAALWESQQRLIFALQGGELGMWDWFLQTGKVIYNELWAQMLEYSIDEVEQSVDFFKQHLHPDDRANVLEKLMGHIEGRLPVYSSEHRLRTKSGTWIWFLDRGKVVERDEFGCAVRATGIIVNITERKQLEMQLQQAQKMEAIGTLAGGIAHDFNNILAAIFGYTELALMNVPAGSTIRQNLEQTMKAADRARSLVKQILSFSRKNLLDRKPVMLHLIIKEALNLLRATLPTTIEIRQKLPKQESLVEADPTQIHQVLMNLCTNAFHAMEKQGGVLEIELTRVNMNREDITSRHTLEPGPYVLLKVSDTGAGIDPEIISRIFEPFFTTKEVGKGTGLGLSVVYGIIKGQGGDITVSSKQGKGTAFSILLPEVSEPAGSEKDENNTTLLSGNEHIMFVDDEATLAVLAKMLLDPLGYKVTSIQSSKEALALFQKAPEKFDLVITDLTMPDMTGYELAQKLISFKPDIPVILCTGNDEMIVENKEKEQRIKAVLTKPFSRRVLAETIRKVLDNKPA